MIAWLSARVSKRRFHTSRMGATWYYRWLLRWRTFQICIPVAEARDPAVIVVTNISVRWVAVVRSDMLSSVDGSVVIHNPYGTASEEGFLMSLTTHARTPYRRTIGT